MIGNECKRRKTVPISFKEVEEAYAVARKGGKAAGIDRESWEDFEREKEKMHIKP